MSLRQEGNAIIWERDYQIMRIEPWGQGSLRVRATMASAIREDLEWALLPPQASAAVIEMHDDHATIRNGAILAKVSATPPGSRSLTPGICFYNAETGVELLAEASAYVPRPPARQFKAVAGDYYTIEARFQAYDDERFYGLGQHQHGRLDQKGCVIDLFQVNTEVNIPFLISSRGYGFLWHNPAMGRVELGREITRWVADESLQLDYWITAGDTPAEILEHYVDATGHAPLLPEFATGFWLCKLRYRTQDELLAVAREHVKRGLPLSIIVVHFFHWSKQGDWHFDPECWPDPAGMARELAEMGVKVMVSVWPTVNAGSKNFSEMVRRGLLVRTERGVLAIRAFRDVGNDGLVYIHNYDPTNPEARQFVWEQARDGYVKNGIKLWWLDACEPQLRPGEPENLRYYLGPGPAVTNLYPLHNAQAFYEGMRAEGEEEILSLCRSAWAGSQRYAAAVWSGDIQSTWEALQAQVPAGLNIGLSGIPWWTTDIGGFYGGDVESPYFRELVVRWFQYSAFCPLFRLHGYRLPNQDMFAGGGPNEVWSFGDEAYGIIRELLFLRERLRPYIMDLMHEAQAKGTPPMRPLFYDNPQDAVCWDVEDQYMLGPDLLVAPILHEGARSRRVYLPGGTRWTDAWTGELLEGGQWIEADAPLDRIPLYQPEGKSLPIRG